MRPCVFAAARGKRPRPAASEAGSAPATLLSGSVCPAGAPAGRRSSPTSSLALLPPPAPFPPARTSTARRPLSWPPRTRSRRCSRRWGRRPERAACRPGARHRRSAPFLERAQPHLLHCLLRAGGNQRQRALPLLPPARSALALATSSSCHPSAPHLLPFRLSEFSALASTTQISRSLPNACSPRAGLCTVDPARCPTETELLLLWLAGAQPDRLWRAASRPCS